MDAAARQAILVELADAFGPVRDVTPASDQPLHVALAEVKLADGWTPSPARVLLRFTGWPATRPEFFIDPGVRNAAGAPPRSNSEEYVLGEPWRQFSWSFRWPASSPNAVLAVEKWLCRFREQT